MVEIEGKIKNAVGMLEDHATELAFFYQLTKKDVSFALSSNKYNGKSAIFVLEDLANMVTGRITGENLFPSVSNYPQTFNLNNGWNSTTEIGVILWGLHELGFASARIGKLGAKVAVGGFVGGIFDDPISTSQNINNVIPTANYSPSVRNGLPVGGGASWLG